MTRLDPQVTGFSVHPRRSLHVTDEGVAIDYEAGQLLPTATLEVVGRQLAKVYRYGCRTSLEAARRCNDLQHSLLVARIARELTCCVSKIPAVHDVVAVYASLHDVGEIFTGDHPLGTPKEVLASLTSYEHWCRNRVLAQMGLPPFPDKTEWMARLIRVADAAAPRAEQAAMGLWTQREASLWCDYMQQIIADAKLPAGLEWLTVDQVELLAVECLVACCALSSADDLVSDAWRRSDNPALQAGLARVQLPPFRVAQRWFKMPVFSKTLRLATHVGRGAAWVVSSEGELADLDLDDASHLCDLSSFNQKGVADVWRVEKGRVVLERCSIPTTSSWKEASTTWEVQ